MKKIKKLIAIDLDGTLVDNNGRLSKETTETINRVQKEGHIVVIVTGRHAMTALPIAEKLGLTDAIVCFNGALIMEVANRKVQVTKAYKNDDIFHLTKFIKSLGYSYVTATKHNYYIEWYDKFLMNNFPYAGADVQVVKDISEVEEPIYKMSIIGNEQGLNKVETIVGSAVPRLEVIRSSEQSIDIINPKASKGFALEWLANYYQIEREHTMAFGNYDNDISMLQYAGLGVAMENAPDHVKRTANTVCHSNEHHGVARFLEENLLQHTIV